MTVTIVTVSSFDSEVEHKLVAQRALGRNINFPQVTISSRKKKGNQSSSQLLACTLTLFYLLFSRTQRHRNSTSPPIQIHWRGSIHWFLSKASLQVQRPAPLFCSLTPQKRLVPSNLYHTDFTAEHNRPSDPLS